MKNFFFALVFIFLAFLAWQYYSRADFNFKLDSFNSLNVASLKNFDFFKDQDIKVEEKNDYQDLKVGEDLTVPKEVVFCLQGAKDNLDKAMETSYSQSEELLGIALNDFNQCQKENDNIEECYENYLYRQNEIVETTKLERVNISNAYQFNLQLCWPDVSAEDLELIFNKI